jgi:hypothetical protein
MAWVKTTQTDSVNSKPILSQFRTYKEVVVDATHAAYAQTSAIPGFTGGGTITGIQTSTATDAADTALVMSLQASMDGTTWGTVKTATVIALVSGESRGFSFDCNGVYAPYFRLYSPLSTHGTSNTITWQICLEG